MQPFRRNLWQLLMHALRQLRAKPRLGDIFAEGAEGPRRRFHRHVIDEPQLATVQVGELHFPVLNIGYGGLRLTFGDDHSFLSLVEEGQMLDFTLCIMGFFYDMRGRLIAIEGGAASFNFEDLTNIDEAFLGSFLFFMDAGIGLKSLSKNVVSTHYRGPGWLSYGGLSGSIEVHLRLDDAGSVDETHVFYLHGFQQDFAVFSKKGVAVASKPVREMTSKEKRQILMRTISILVGLRQVGRTKRLDIIIESGIQRLRRPVKGAA